MAGSYNSDTIRANQRHIMSYFDDPENFVADVEHFMRYETRGASPYNAILGYARQGNFLIYVDDIKDYLASIGYPPSAKYDDYQVQDFYHHMMARDGSRLYELIKSGRMPDLSAPAKRPAKKTKSTKTGTKAKAQSKCVKGKAKTAGGTKKPAPKPPAKKKTSAPNRKPLRNAKGQFVSSRAKTATKSKQGSAQRKSTTRRRRI